jgi:hypothetical protein
MVVLTADTVIELVRRVNVFEFWTQCLQQAELFLTFASERADFEDIKNFSNFVCWSIDS